MHWPNSVHTTVCVCVCVCLFFVRVYVCLPLRLLITNGIIWTPYDWLHKFYIAAIVGIISRCSINIDVLCENQPNKHKLTLFKLLIHFNSSLKCLYKSSKTEWFIYKRGCGMTCIKAFKRTASFDYI